MTFSGPLSISGANAPSSQEMGLRPFQRIVARVIEVTGTTALLSIEGTPIVTQLTSPEQATALRAQQTAQFIVTELSKQKITLKLIDDTPSAIVSSASSPTGIELAVRVLEEHNLPATINNLMMARSLLKQHLPVTTSLLNELMEALSEYGSPGSKEVDLATSLKAAGLPVSAQSIALLSRQPAKISDSISQLIKWFNELASPGLSAELLKQLELNMRLFNQMVLDGDQETSMIAEQFKAALETLGRSLENVLLEQSQKPEADLPGTNPSLSLVHLQKMLEQVGRNEAAEFIDHFLEDVRSTQLLNLRSPWAEIELPIQSPQKDQGFATARLRIARNSHPDSGKIDLTSTRLVLQVEINPQETVEVDLALMGKLIRTSVTAPNPVWCQEAESELPSLHDALEGLGFTVKDTQVTIGEPQPFTKPSPISDNRVLMTVDIEV